MRVIKRCRCRKFLKIENKCCGDYVYWIEYRHNGELKRQKIGTDLQIARIALADIEKSILLNKYVGKKNDLTFSQIKDWYTSLKEIKSLRSYTQTVNILNRFSGHFGAFLIDSDFRDKIAVYLSERSEACSIATVNRDLAAVRSMLETAEKYDKIPKNVLKAIPYSQVDNDRIVTLTKQEVDDIIFGCDPKIKDIVKFASLHLMRWREIMNLEWADIDENWIKIRASCAKSKKTRRCPLNPEGYSIISRFPSRFTRGKIFPQIPYSTFNRHWKEAIGGKDILFHDLRHYCADQMKEKYAVENIMRWAGWESMRMFHRYTTDLGGDSRKNSRQCH